MFSRHIFLIMRIITHIIINMDNIRHERLSEGPILNLNRRVNIIHETRNLSHVSRSLWPLRSWKNKQCNIPKLLAENPRVGWKIGYFSKVKGLLIQKLENISIRCLVYSQRLHCWLVADSFLVCQLKIGGVLNMKVAPE